MDVSHAAILRSVEDRKEREATREVELTGEKCALVKENVHSKGNGGRNAKLN